MANGPGNKVSSKQGFSSFVSDWTTKNEGRMTAVLRQSAQQVSIDVRVPKAKGGNMPVDTGNLRRSLLASKESMPTLSGDNKAKFTEPGTQITTVIASLKLGENLFLGFQARYARIQEEVNGFVRLTAQRWPQIVAQASRTIQTRVEARLKGK